MKSTSCRNSATSAMTSAKDRPLIERGGRGSNQFFSVRRLNPLLPHIGHGIDGNRKRDSLKEDKEVKWKSTGVGPPEKGTPQPPTRTAVISWLMAVADANTSSAVGFTDATDAVPTAGVIVKDQLSSVPRTPVATSSTHSFQ